MSPPLLCGGPASVLIDAGASPPRPAPSSTTTSVAHDSQTSSQADGTPPSSAVATSPAPNPAEPSSAGTAETPPLTTCASADSAGEATVLATATTASAPFTSSDSGPAADTSHNASPPLPLQAAAAPTPVLAPPAPGESQPSNESSVASPTAPPIQTQHDTGAADAPAQAAPQAGEAREEPKAGKEGLECVPAGGS